MKKLILFLGVIFLLPGFITGQDTSYLTRKEYKLEKAQLLRTIYQTTRDNQALLEKIQLQALTVDSLNRMIALQKEEINAQHGFLNQLESYQADLDGRLLTQRKSGTLLAILIPVGLFLFFLLLLVWLMIFRHRTLSMFNSAHDRLDELTKQLDDQMANYKRDQNSIREEVKASGKELDNKLQKAVTEMKEELASHDARHAESSKEYENFKGSFQKSYDSVATELGKLKEELAANARDFAQSLKDLAKKRGD